MATGKAGEVPVRGPVPPARGKRGKDAEDRGALVQCPVQAPVRQRPGVFAFVPGADTRSPMNAVAPACSKSAPNAVPL
jgi:hypothetical protein